MTTGLFLLSAGAAFFLLFAWALVRAASQTPRRGEMARFVQPPQKRMTLIKPTNKGPKEAA
jgi:hypothetical protein